MDEFVAVHPWLALLAGVWFVAAVAAVATFGMIMCSFVATRRAVRELFDDKDEE